MKKRWEVILLWVCLFLLADGVIDLRAQAPDTDVPPDTRHPPASGRSVMSPDIVGGEEAEPGAWPWQAALVNGTAPVLGLGLDTQSWAWHSSGGGAGKRRLGISRKPSDQSFPACGLATPGAGSFWERPMLETGML